MTITAIGGPTTALDAFLYVSRGIVPGNVMALEKTMASVRENLIAAKALIADPAHWIKDDLRNDDFTCFCALGAIETAGNYISSTGFFDAPEVHALAAALGAHSWTDVSYFNDAHDTTHADVMALFDRAIAASMEVPD